MQSQIYARPTIATLTVALAALVHYDQPDAAGGDNR